MAALTLAQALVGVPNAISSNLADSFEKSSYVFQQLPFDTTAQAGGMGWVYQYERVTTGSTANVRAINAEYTESQALKTAYTVNLKVLGGSFKMDRATVNLANSASKIAFQVEQMKKGVIAKFNDLFINGDAGTTAEEFTGIQNTIVDGATEIDGASLDLSTIANIKTNGGTLLHLLDNMLATMDGTPTALFMNKAMLSVLKAIGRETTAYTTTTDKFGATISSFDGIPLISLGEKSGSTTEIIPTATGLTSIYAVRFGLDGVHGILPGNVGSALNVVLPDLTTPGAVKTGEVELITALAMQTSKCAAKIKSIKVA